MQVKIKLGREWWLLPTKQEFTKKELDLFSDIPYVAPLQVGEAVRFFDIRPKKIVKVIIGQIGNMHHQGYKPVLKNGTITFRKV